MALDYVDLDDTTRQLMLEELNSDISDGVYTSALDQLRRVGSGTRSCSERRLHLTTTRGSPTC